MNSEDIKKLCEKFGAGKLAQKVGVSRQTIHRWETGKSKPHNVFVKIMEGLQK